jgi:hypothetical protein
VPTKKLSVRKGTASDNCIGYDLSNSNSIFVR